jgi:hypothetical protein
LTKLQKRIRLVVDLLNAANRVEQMPPDEIRVILRRAAALLIQNADTQPVRRPELAAKPDEGFDDYPPVPAAASMSLARRFNWRLFSAVFASTFLSLTVAGLLVGYDNIATGGISGLMSWWNGNDWITIAIVGFLAIQALIGVLAIRLLWPLWRR